MRFLRSLLLVALLTTALLSAASVDGIRINSSVSGKGPTVILVHGWTCDQSTWDAQVPALAANYRVITLDLPGHGKSGAPKDGKFSMNLFARAVEAVRKDTKADRVVLVGHSMGTPVIVQYARLYPQHVAALVFVDGVVSIPRDGSGNVPNPQAMAGPNGPEAREQLIRTMFSQSTTPDMQKRILNMMLAAPEATATGAMAATFDPAIWKDDVLAMPILGLYAHHSGLANHEYMKTHFPAMEYIEIPGTGHFLMIEKSREFNDLLLAFLAKQRF